MLGFTNGEAERRRHGELELTGVNGGRWRLCARAGAWLPFIGKGGGGGGTGGRPRHLGKVYFAWASWNCGDDEVAARQCALVHSGWRVARPGGLGRVALARAARGDGQGRNRGRGQHRGGIPSPAYGRRERRGERDAVSGILVNNSKFCIQFTKLYFSPFSWPQKKKYRIPFLFRFLRSTTFISGTFSFEQYFVS